MARKSSQFLPQVFQTKTNLRFLNATMDQLIQEPNLKRISGYVGRKDISPGYSKTDSYVVENDKFSDYYQLEPSLVVRKRIPNTNNYRVDNVYNYLDLLNQISAQGGINVDHNRLFSQEYYSYEGFVDLDKLINYSQYYWLPSGPPEVEASAGGAETSVDFFITKNQNVVDTNLQTTQALGAAYYTITSTSVIDYSTSANPTITLVRGGSYRFNVNTPSTNFRIQTVTGTSTTSVLQDNVDITQVFGVQNNNIDTGQVVFNVPKKTAQDYYVNLAITPNYSFVDMVITDLSYNQIQNQTYADFVLNHTIDGVTTFTNKLVVFTSDLDDRWIGVDEVGYTDPWAVNGSVPKNLRKGIWQLVNNVSTGKIELKYLADFPSNTKTLVKQGRVWGNLYIFKDNELNIQKVPPVTATLDTLYYQDGTDNTNFGIIKLIDPDPSSVLDVTGIIGQPTYITPNGINLQNGMILRFVGFTNPSSYEGKSYIVEGVGTAITLTPWNELIAITPEVQTVLGDGYDSSTQPYDYTGLDQSSGYPVDKEYIVINRSSSEASSWSRVNRWFHKDLISYVIDKSGSTNFTLSDTNRAIRPIIEFDANLQLFNHGTQFGQVVNVYDTSVTATFQQVEGRVNNILTNDQIYPSIKVNSKQYTGYIKNALTTSTVFHGNNVIPVDNVSDISFGLQVTGASLNVSTVGITSSGSNDIIVSDTTNLGAGQPISGTNIPDGTTILQVNYTNNHITISSSTTGSIPAGTALTAPNIPANTFVLGVDTVNNTVSVSNTLFATLNIGTQLEFKTNNITGSNKISVTTTENVVVNQRIIGAGIQSYTYVTGVDSVNNVISITKPLIQDIPVNSEIRIDSIDSTTYFTDGIRLIDGTTVVFSNDANPDIRKTVYRVDNIKPRTYATYNILSVAYTNSGVTQIKVNDANNLNISQAIVGNGIPLNTFITAIDYSNNIITINNPTSSGLPVGTGFTVNNDVDVVYLNKIYEAVDGDAILISQGLTKQGKMYYFQNGYWIEAQNKTSRNQQPKFEIYDINGVSFGDKSYYTSSTFDGSYLFGYKPSTSINYDSELGFAISYKSIQNLGDIEFQNFYDTDSFHYTNNQVDTIISTNTGFAKQRTSDGYVFKNNWQKVKDYSKQFIQRKFTTQLNAVNNFDLNLVFQNSSNEKNIYVYINQVEVEYTSFKLLTVGNTTVLQFNNDLPVDSDVLILIKAKSTRNAELYTVPKNLENNSENNTFASLTLGQIRNHLIEIGNNCLSFKGEAAGSNNFRNINYKNVPGKILQHSGSVHIAQLLLNNSQTNLISSINFNRQRYNKFKEKFLQLLGNAEFSDQSNYRACLDQILNEITNNSSSNQAFYSSDMVAYGKQYIVNSYVTVNSTYKTFNLVNTYASGPSFMAVLVYKNNTLLQMDYDYTITNNVLALTSNVNLVVDDVIDVYEYSTTQGCMIPATPTKLGLYPKYKPKIFTDNTYLTPTLVIQGHDGSLTPAFNDYRDNVLLEFENRVFNNLKVSYADLPMDLREVEPGAFRQTDYSLGDWTQLLSSSFLSWAGDNGVDIFKNTTVSNDLFSFNYSQSEDLLFGESVPGYWRGIFKYFYDCDRPDTAPWEMLGMTEKPDYWDIRYGPAPYTKGNQVMWTDLELGRIYTINNTYTIDTKYARPGLSEIIPVDEHGNLLPPFGNIVTNYQTNTSGANWKFGDQSPQETSWRRSSDYPFAIQIAWALARPAQYATIALNTRDVRRLALLDQVININSGKRALVLSVNELDGSVTGTNLWIVDRLKDLNLDVTTYFKEIFDQYRINLSYKLGGFTDKNYIKVVADQLSPGSSNTSVLVPEENYHVVLTKSAPMARMTYSGVIVQKNPDGYSLHGFDNVKPYFNIIPSLINNNRYTLNVVNETGIVYNDAQNTILTVPYGTVYSTKQQVVDVLISYGRYLTSQGFIFKDVLEDQATTKDWSLAVKEFLYWLQQGWDTDTVISLTPASTEIKFDSGVGFVDTLSNTQTGTRVINSDGKTLSGKDYRTYREGTGFSITLKDITKGIHLLDLEVIQYEHTIIFDNNTVFNDVIYQPNLANRQYRMLLRGYKTQDWNGSLYAPGFLVNQENVQEWQALQDYFKGDIVKFKNKYYTAQKFLAGSQKFDATGWYEISSMLVEKQLIPNPTFNAQQFEGFYDVDSLDINVHADNQGRHSTGFAPRNYLTDLGLDNISQHKFYLGMIKQKGTQSVVNAYLRGKQKYIDNRLDLLEQWGIRLGNYGGTEYRKDLEISMANATSQDHAYVIELIDDNTARDSRVNTFRKSDLLLTPAVFDPNIFATDESQSYKVMNAGHVLPTEVSAVVFDIKKIYNINNIAPALGEGSTIWVAMDNSNSWNVYRLSNNIKCKVVSASQPNANEIEFRVTAPHGLFPKDYVMLKNARYFQTVGRQSINMNGFYRVTSVGNDYFRVAIEGNIQINTGNMTADVFKMKTVKYYSKAEFAQEPPPRGWQVGDQVWISNTLVGKQVLINTKAWDYQGDHSPAFSLSTDKFGSDVRINYAQNLSMVGAPSYLNNGIVWFYGLDPSYNWSEIASIFPTDSTYNGFGQSVTFDNNNRGYVSAPLSTMYNVIDYVATGATNTFAIPAKANGLNLPASVYLVYVTDNSNVTTQLTPTTDFTTSGNNLVLTATPAPNNKVSIAYIDTTGRVYVMFSQLGNINFDQVIHSNGVGANALFGQSIAVSKDGNYLYVGAPGTNTVYAYKYTKVNVTNDTQTFQVGSTPSTDFLLPLDAQGIGLTAPDIRVTLDNKLQVPNYDYYIYGNDIRFRTAPSSNSIVKITYKDYFKLIGTITAAGASGFGTSVDTSIDGRRIFVGAPNTTVTTTSGSFNNQGQAYVYDRTAERFVGDGATKVYNLVNTPSNIRVTVDAVDVSNYTLNTNTLTFATAPSNGSDIIVETNNFRMLKSFTAPAGQGSLLFGTSVVVCPNTCSYYVGAPGYNNSSGSNGSVYRYVATPRLYGTVVGTVTNPTVTIGHNIRINDYLITFTGTTLDSVITNINARAIPGIIASKSNNKLKIVSDNLIIGQKLIITYDSGTALTDLGINLLDGPQQILPQYSYDSAVFGNRLAISPDAYKLVVGATNETSRKVTIFDGGKTRFDADSVVIVDKIYRSGNAHIYEYQPSSTETYNNPGFFSLATTLSNENLGSTDQYGTAVAISNNYVMASAPNGNALSVNGVTQRQGVLHVYKNANNSSIWQVLRTEQDRPNSRNIERIYLYNDITKELIVDLPVIDPELGLPVPSAAEQIKYIAPVDPAIYSNSTTTYSFGLDQRQAWGAEHVGELWWDTNAIKYLDWNQGDIINRFKNWGLAFPSSYVRVYEWIESKVPPNEYSQRHSYDGPLYTASDVYSYKTFIDENGLASTRYYFWVVNSSVNPMGDRRETALQLQRLISNPRNIGEPFAAVIGTNSLAIINAEKYVNSNTVLHISYTSKTYANPVNTEWTMFDDGSITGVASEVLVKMRDSMATQDIVGRTVPDTALTNKQRYGMDFVPRQTIFSDPYQARKIWLETVNAVLASYPIVLLRNITNLQAAEPEPDVSNYSLDERGLPFVVDTDTELEYINKFFYDVGTLVLVHNDSASNSWTIRKLEQDPHDTNIRYWTITRAQTYDVKKYWAYMDWYAAGYSENTIENNYTIDTEADIVNLPYVAGDIIYVKNSTSGGWKYQLVTKTGLQLIAQQNATIQFTTNVYDNVAAGFGFDNYSFQTIGFGTDSNIEFSMIFDIVNNDILINDLATYYKTLIGTMIDQIAKQFREADWISKTSFLDINHHIRGLDAIPVYVHQPEQNVQNFLSENKPYHVKIKRYTSSYDNLETGDINTTDFDLPSYYDKTHSRYHSPQLSDPNDSQIGTPEYPGKFMNPIYNQWFNNHTYSLESINVFKGGQDYDVNTYVKITGDGTGAMARPIVINGAILEVVLEKVGTGYTYANVEIVGIGRGAKAFATLGNPTTRTISTTIKFDRYTYANVIQDWQPNTAYNTGDVFVYDDTEQKQPYRVVSSFTSGVKFDFQNIVLYRAREWKQYTNYAKDDIVVYDLSLGLLYIVTQDFTTGSKFDTTYLTLYTGFVIDNASDRIWSYYKPGAGQPGRDLAQLMKGIEYEGDRVYGPDFGKQGYDTQNYDDTIYDQSDPTRGGLYDAFGSPLVDTVIQSAFNDTSLGIRPEDIIFNGGEFVDTYNSHAPEELIPGQLFDTLDIRVTTAPNDRTTIANSSDISALAYSGDGVTSTFTYDPYLTGVRLPIGGIEFFEIIIDVINPQIQDIDYTVDYTAKTITFVNPPPMDSGIFIIMFGSTGNNVIFDGQFISDGMTVDYVLPNFSYADVKQAYVKIDGHKTTAWTLVNQVTYDLTGTRVISQQTIIRFNTPPAEGSLIQIHLYNVNPGIKAYSEIREDVYTVTADNPAFPDDYRYTLVEPQVGYEPYEANVIVRWNENDLTPSNQAYYTGDGVTTLYSLSTTRIVADVNTINDPDIKVIVDGVQKYNLIDYTIVRDGIHVPKVQLLSAPKVGAKITVADVSQAAYRILDGTTLQINPSIVLNKGDRLSVISYSNYNPLDTITQVFSGPNQANIITLGFDRDGWDLAQFDNDQQNLTNQAILNLSRPVTNLDYLYIVLKNTNDPTDVGSYFLSPHAEYELITPTKILFSNDLNLSSSNLITVKQFSESVRYPIVEYRLFKDMNENTSFYGIGPTTTTVLSQDLNITDEFIYVEDINVLEYPDPIGGVPGSMFINGEKINYNELDTVNSRVGRLRRGVSGTGVAETHLARSYVYNAGINAIVPNSSETFVVTDRNTLVSNDTGLATGTVTVPTGTKIRQGQLWYTPGASTASNGLGLQFSNTPQANFLKSL